MRSTSPQSGAIGASVGTVWEKLSMRIRPQYVVAGGIIGVFALYFAVTGLAGSGGTRKAEAATQKPDIPTVQAALVEPVMRPYVVVVRGRTQAFRIVSVRSETSGVVASTPVREGSPVKEGQVLCKLKVDARQAAVDQAKANLRAKQLTQKASAELVRRGYRSQTQMLTDQAGMDEASAAVRQAEVALGQTDIRAPFAGVFNERDIEVGGFLAPGGACGVVIELDPLKITGPVPETQIGKLKVGAPAHAVLASGERLDGSVYYVAKDADAQTRTYQVMLTVPNPGTKVQSGLSADVRIEAGEGPAYLVPSSSLVLDSAGQQGVRYVQGADQVAFAPVKVVDETPQGIWVTGLSGPARVITVGQAYVSEGQRVRVASR
jgi:multidrug efflux system membrane fusion protein